MNVNFLFRLITSFYTYTGPWDAAPGATPQHNEIDIEFIYKTATDELRLQANYYTDGEGGHEHYISLPATAVQEYHNYAFRWTSNKIEWFIDGAKVHTATQNIPQASNGHHKIMMNLWPVSPQVSSWGGLYVFDTPKTASYDGVRFTKGECCQVSNSF